MYNSIKREELDTSTYDKYMNSLKKQIAEGTIKKAFEDLRNIMIKHFESGKCTGGNIRDDNPDEPFFRIEKTMERFKNDK